jgi:hypothetical protein
VYAELLLATLACIASSPPFDSRKKALIPRPGMTSGIQTQREDGKNTPSTPGAVHPG